MKKFKKILSLVLAIIMIATTIPFAFAAETPIAKIGDVEYTDFDEALANWVDGTTLTLLDNVSYGTTINILNKSVVLDLNGKTLDMSTLVNPIILGDSEYIFEDEFGNYLDEPIRIVIPGKLTIKDSNEGGTLKGKDEYGNSVVVYDTFNLESGNLIGRIYNMGTTNISGGSVMTISQALESGNVTSVFNISGGEISGNYGMWINCGVVNISGSPKITGTNGYAIRNFEDVIINITGTPVLTGTNGDIYECYHENVNRISSNGDGTHKMICFCGSNSKDVVCSGGIATCKNKAVCEICGVEYGDVDENNHNFVNGICSACGNVKDIIGSLSSQIRFQRNADSSYAEKFDVRTRATISDEDFTTLVGATNTEASKNIKKVGFVYSINPDTFSIEDAKTVAKGGEVAGYTDAPVKYIQDADGYYMFTCLVTDIPSTATNYTLISYAYICVEIDGVEKWYFMETQAEADFNNLYSTYYPIACEKYGW